MFAWRRAGFALLSGSALLLSTAALGGTTPIPKAKPATKLEHASVAGSPAPLPQFDDRLVKWLAAISGDPGVSSAAIAATIADCQGWPGQTLLRLRYEQALRREQPKPETVLRAFDERPPMTGDGSLLLARALISVGRKDDAEKLIRDLWRSQDISEAGIQALLRDFASVLGPADHWARVDRLLYAGNVGPALRTASLLDEDHRLLAEARAAVIRGSGTATKLLDGVPEGLRREPGYILARAQQLRRTGSYREAASLLMSAPTDAATIVNPDVWSEERRLVARQLLDLGDPATAYRLVDAAAATSQTARVEAEFEAGWYALEFLRDLPSARRHFEAILRRSDTPVSQARGFYWLGRVAEAEGDAVEAERRFRRSALFPMTFYGQISAAHLKQTTLAVKSPPDADPAAKARFEGGELIQSIVQLHRTRHDEEVVSFFHHLATTLVDPAELTLLAGLAQQQKRYSTVVEIGKAAQARGLNVGSLAFPTNVLPAYTGPSKIGLPVLYAVARQESTFDQSVVSSAGAVGVLQIMPQFAKETALKAGLPYLKEKVKTDPIYNMQLGAAELAGLIDAYNGSYLLAFAAYNAGPGRVAQWIRSYGDPRDPTIDPLNWIERIPFSETRNYVQRALENLGVYRARLGDPALKIEDDLRGGA